HRDPMHSRTQRGTEDTEDRGNTVVTQINGQLISIGKTAASYLCVLCTLCVLCAAPGCGYALAGRGSFLPDYVRTIGIPTFLHRTKVFNLETMLTEKVRAEFIGRGKYQTLPESTGVDALLTGEVANVAIVP